MSTDTTTTPANDNATAAPACLFLRLRAYTSSCLPLIPNWRATLRYAWSVKVDAFLIVLSGAEFGINAVAGSPPIDPMKFAAIAFLVKAAGLGLRFVYQPKVAGGGE